MGKYNTNMIVGLQYINEGKDTILKHEISDSKYLVVANTNEFTSIIPDVVKEYDLNIVYMANAFIDIDMLIKEMLKFEKTNGKMPKIWIDYRANILMPYHILIEKARKKVQNKGNNKVNIKGTNIAFFDKIQNSAIRFSDLINIESLPNKIKSIVKGKNNILSKLGEKELEDQYIIEKLIEYAKILKSHIIDAHSEILSKIEDGEKIVIKSNVSTLSDINYGIYPDIESVNATVAGICSELGISPYKIENRIGVIKAYISSKNEGFLASEVFYDVKEHIISNGEMKNNVKVGWLDLAALKYSLTLNDINKIYLTKLNVLTGLDRIKIAVAYEVDKIVYQTFPFNISNISEFNVIYKEFDSWQEDICKIDTYENLPNNCRRYIEYIEGYLGIKFDIIQVGLNDDKYITR